MGQGLQNEKEKGEKMNGRRGDDGGPKGRLGGGGQRRRWEQLATIPFLFFFSCCVFPA